MAPFYPPSVYDATRPVGSYWEATAGPAVAGCPPLEGSATAEAAIIGGGYTGLSAALHLARDHGIDARVLEAGVPGWGASGRNGGFCCIGGAKLSYATMIRRFGLEETRRFRSAQLDAVAAVRDIVAEEGLEVDQVGAGAVEVAHKPGRMAELRALRDVLAEAFGESAELWSREELAERAYRGPEAHGALIEPDGFGLHPLKYARGLARAARAHGAVIHGESRVLAWRREGAEHLLETARGVLRARRVLVATNGFAPERLHPVTTGRVLPAFSNILTTRPLRESELAAQGWRTESPVNDVRNLVFYFRLLPGRVFMFGARGGTSGTPESAARRRAWMERRLARMFPAWSGVETTHFWRGLIAIARDRVLHVARHPDDPTVHYAMAYHGNGVSFATWAGRAVAAEIAGRPEVAPIPAIIARPIPRFPLPGLRKLYLRAAYAAFNVADEWL